MSNPDNERIENLKKMYRKYMDARNRAAASRTLARLRELGVSQEEITQLIEAP